MVAAPLYSPGQSYFGIFHRGRCLFSHPGQPKTVAAHPAPGGDLGQGQMGVGTPYIVKMYPLGLLGGFPALGTYLEKHPFLP